MDCPGFQIVHYGIYDSRVDSPRGHGTPPRYVLRFELELYTEDLDGITWLDGQQHPLKKGLFLCCKPGQQRKSRGSVRCCYLHLLTADPALLALLHNLPDACLLSDPTPVHKAFDRLISLPPEERRDPLLVSALALQLLSFLRRATAAEIQAGSTFSRSQRNTMLRTEQYIRGNLTEPMTLKALAARAGFSPAHFHRLFTSFFGKTPYAFTLECRIEAAIASLQTDCCSLADIASGCGFSSQSHFSALFKNATGMTPNEYRKRLLSHPEV